MSRWKCIHCSVNLVRPWTLPTNDILWNCRQWKHALNDQIFKFHHVDLVLSCQSFPTDNIATHCFIDMSVQQTNRSDTIYCLVSKYCRYKRHIIRKKITWVLDVIPMAGVVPKAGPRVERRKSRVDFSKAIEASTVRVWITHLLIFLHWVSDIPLLRSWYIWFQQGCECVPRQNIDIVTVCKQKIHTFSNEIQSW